MPRGASIVHTDRLVEKAELIWKNGEFVPWDEANVHVLTHGLHYGTGVFEGIRCYDTEIGPAIFRHQDHLDRLAKSAELYYLPLAYSLEEIREATKELIRRNGLRSCYIRPLAFRGYGEMGLYAQERAGRRGHRRLALGRLSGRGGQEEGRPRQGLLLAADLARRADPARQGLGPVPQLDPRQDRDAPTPATTRRSCSTSAASSARAPARTSTWSARARSSRPGTARLDPRRDQPQVGDPDRARPRLHRRRARRRARRALPGRGGLPDRHRRRAGAGPRDRRPRPRASPARSPA